MKRGIKEGEDEYVDGIISDKAAAMYGASLSSGLICAPLLGSVIYEVVENKNFNKTTDVFFFIAAAYTVVFFFADFIFDIHKEKEE